MFTILSFWQIAFLVVSSSMSAVIIPLLTGEVPSWSADISFDAFSWLSVRVIFLFILHFSNTEETSCPITYFVTHLHFLEGLPGAYLNLYVWPHTILCPNVLCFQLIAGHSKSARGREILWFTSMTAINLQKLCKLHSWSHLHFWTLSGDRFQPILVSSYSDVQSLEGKFTE